jgi:hypothetical protein
MDKHSGCSPPHGHRVSAEVLFAFIWQKPGGEALLCCRGQALYIDNIAKYTKGALG